jgi:hypothetical protein
MMKKLLGGLLLWLLPLFGYATHMHWMGQYDAALQRAISEYKPLLVLVVKKDDSSSKIIQQALMDQPYIEKLDKQFISVIVTYEGAQSYPIEMYYTTVFPTLFFVDSSSELFLEKPLYGEEIRAETLAKIIQNLDIIPTKSNR